MSKVCHHHFPAFQRRIAKVTESTSKAQNHKVGATKHALGKNGAFSPVEISAALWRDLVCLPLRSCSVIRKANTVVGETRNCEQEESRARAMKRRCGPEFVCVRRNPLDATREKKGKVEKGWWGCATPVPAAVLAGC